MSLQLIAKQMEAKGRKGDSMLVHMTPGEVAGLQKLAEAAGGSLTVNPETGLVEANFLKSMLPTLVGVGVGMVAGPWAGAMAGAAIGGYQAKRDDQDVLTGALMGGLGGYGGGSLGAGLSAAGTSGLQQAAMQDAIRQQATQQTANIASNIGTSAMPETAAQAAGRFGVQLTGAPSMATTQAAPIMGTEAGAQQILGAADGAATQYNQLGFFDKAKAGFQGLGTQAGRDAAMAELGGTKGAMRSGLMALSPALNAPVEEQESPYPLMSMELNKAPSQNLSAYEGAMPSYNYQGSNVYIPTFRAAEGGLAELAKGGMKEGGFVWPADVVSMVGEGNTEAGYKRIAEAFPGSVPIRGEDGGQADTVKTSIEGKQPARVAHGEVYSEPKTVERAGGAKKLYAIMDRVREQATGSKKQIKPVRLESAMA